MSKGDLLSEMSNMSNGIKKELIKEILHNIRIELDVTELADEKELEVSLYHGEDVISSDYVYL